MIGKTLAHYEITGLLGKGGMGEVYRARDGRLKREVALKVLPSEMAADPHRLERFQREAETVAGLSHPNIVTLYSVEEVDGVHFLTMELVEGQTLDQLLPEGGLPLDRLLELAAPTADALRAAHQKGIVHRDLKPSNLMVDEEGRVKILDFGLAKLQPEAGVPEVSQLATEALTGQGVVMGTAPYMSPEQIEAGPIDHRSDIFSLGIILYEMATGRRPFKGDSAPALMSSILRDKPPSVTATREELPRQLGRIVRHCLEKDPNKRFQTARDIHYELEELRRELELEITPAETGLSAASPVPAAASDAAPPVSAARPAAPTPRKPLQRVWVAFLGLLLLGSLGWLGWQMNRSSWARNQALPELAVLAEARRFSEAVALAERAERFVAGDAVLLELWPKIAVELDVESEPNAALVEVRPYASKAGDWRRLGRTPIHGLRLPKGAYRWRFSKDGAETIERAAEAAEGALRVELPPAGTVPEDMVLVRKRVAALFLAAFGLPRVVELEDYFIQRHEVTNRQFKEFVDAGGYGRRELWKHPFVEDGRTLAWEEAIERFRDQAGQPGPATWEVGAYPSGQDDWPIGGVSWYEAAAYAEFVGLSLPTLNHWYRAAGVPAGPYLLPLANFDHQGALAVGTSEAMSPLGTYDMAGNVKEWALNASSQGLRYSVGGGWGEPLYMFGNVEPRSPFDRHPSNGFRLAQYTGGGEPDERSAATFDRAVRDYRLEPPVPDETFELFTRMQRYAPTPLEARVEKQLETAEARVERVSFAGTYSNERVAVYLWLPKDLEPPYQTLVLFPGSEALRPAGGEVLEQPEHYDFLVRSGRAVVHPVYSGMYERYQGPLPREALALRDFQLRWSQDMHRTLEYLETRPDIDQERLGYFGASLGAWHGPIPLAIEPRFDLGILVGGALSPMRFEPEVDTLNYLPRVKQPLLLLCGRYDYFFPYEASQKPFFERLGTAPEDKRHVVVDSGHSVPRADYLKEVLGWLDKYFGPARG